MPLRAEPVRRRIEWAARGLVLALLALALWRALSPAASGAREIDSVALGGELGNMLSGEGSTHIRLRSVVTPTARDAVAAARRAGVRVSWSADSAIGWAAAAEPERGPGGLVRVAVAGVGECRGTGTVECGGTGVIRDTLGFIDSITLRNGGATATLATGRGLRFAAPLAQVPLATPPRDTLPWRALVLARAGWEAKFVMAALEEHGWTVSARLAVAPGADVLQGAVLPRDDALLVRSTRSREPFDVIVVLDSLRAGADARAISRFVRGGGGLVLAGEGAAALPDLAPARALGPSRSPRGDAVVTRELLPLRALTGVRSDAVVLESRDRTAAVAARAEGQGRVVQIGYDDTWRWRMQGGETAVTDHRAFWARALAGVAPHRGVPPSAPEGAPRARLVAAWGPMIAAPVRPAGTPTARWLWPFVALVLVAEWASRRTRGAA